MNIAELQKALADLHVRPGAVGIAVVGIAEENLQDEQYRLEKRPGENWLVYYSERGQAAGLRQFFSEEEACQHLIDIIRKDKTTRMA